MKTILLNMGVLAIFIGCFVPQKSLETKEDTLTVTLTDDTKKVKEDTSTVTLTDDRDKVKEDTSTVTLTDDRDKVKEDTSTGDTDKVKEDTSTVVEKIKKNYDEAVSSIKNKDYTIAYSSLQQISSICNLESNDTLEICAKSFYNKGIIEENRNKYQDAVNSYEKALTFGFEKKKEVITEKLANLYFSKIFNFNESVKYFLEVYQNFNKSNDILLNYYIGSSYVNLKRYKDAKPFLLKAKNGGNNDAEYLWFKYELYGY